MVLSLTNAKDITAMPKTKCPKCRRKMCVEHETHEECTDPKCSYYVSYDYDVPEGVSDGS
jgi:hypothetical protein